MKNPISSIVVASKTVFSTNKGYWVIFLIFFILSLIFFVLIPVWVVPGNDIFFQLSLFSWFDWILFIILACFISLLLTMQIFIFKQARQKIIKIKKGVGNIVMGLTGVYSGILGGVFATAACSWCIAAVFGFLGSGTVLFIAQNQLWAVLLAISLMFFSVYFVSLRITNDCNCEISSNFSKENIDN